MLQGKGNKGVGHEITSWKRTGYPIGICAIAGIGEKPLFQRPRLNPLATPLELVKSKDNVTESGSLVQMKMLP